MASNRFAPLVPMPFPASHPLLPTLLLLRR
jgi:hypothetical protein